MNKIPRAVILVLMAAAVILPLTILVLWAVSSGWKYPNLLPQFSFDTIKSYFESNMISKVFVNSVILSSIVTLFSAILGILPAKYLGTLNFRGKTLLYILMMIPAMTPGICIVFGTIGVTIRLDIYRQYYTMVLAQLAFTLPYFIFTLTPVFKKYDLDYEKQSMMLGVGTVNTFFNVTLPSVKSGLAISCMYAFIISWSTYLITTVTAPNGFSTIATELIPMISSSSVTYSSIAVCVILFILPALIFLIVSALIIKSDDANTGGPQ